MKDLSSGFKNGSSTKWLTYSGVAAAFLGATNKADAQIVFTEVDPDSVLTNEIFEIDFDSDGVVDVTVGHATSSGLNIAGLIVVAGNEAIGSLSGNFMYPSVLAAGAAIAPGDPNFQTATFGTLRYAYGSAGYGQWDGQHGYIGYKFMGGDAATHYGWIELSVATGATSATVHGYAYEMMADMAIAAGDEGASGVNDRELLSMSVFPNPTNGNVNMTLGTTKAGTYQVSVINGAGQVLSTRQETVNAGTSTLAVDMSGIAPGTYFVRVANGKNVRHVPVTKFN